MGEEAGAVDARVWTPSLIKGDLDSLRAEVREHYESIVSSLPCSLSLVARTKDSIAGRTSNPRPITRLDGPGQVSRSSRWARSVRWSGAPVDHCRRAEWTTGPDCAYYACSDCPRCDEEVYLGGGERQRGVRPHGGELEYRWESVVLLMDSSI